ncbi:MAG: efflux RND transporter periplasmic adaptor subunit [Betaproteobacteria bacterium]
MRLGRLVGAAVAVVIVLGLALGGQRLLEKRKASATLPAPTVSTVELAATDLVAVQEVDLALGLPVSGTLRAIHSAVLKTRVAGELQGLKVREGEAVKAGQVLAQIDPTEYRARLQQAQQQADSARAQTDIAQRQLDNNRALVAQNFISQTALEASLSNLQAAQANHRAALAAVDVARKSLDDTALVAPISGQVAQRLSQPGERLAIDARILEIVDSSRLELEANIAAGDSVRLKLGQMAQLQVEGSPVTLQAKLVRINPSAQAASRSVLAYLSVDARGAGNALRQGLYAQGQLGTGRSRVLAVPLSALRTDQPQAYVQVLRDGQVAHQPVQAGVQGTAGEEVMVAVDLSAGTQVLRASVGLLRPGMPARITALPAPTPRQP